MVENKRWRTIILYKDYFSDFFNRQRIKVKEKISWTIDLIENHERIPEIHLKHLEDTEGLYEIRVQLGNDEIGFFVFLTRVNWSFLRMDFIRKARRHQRKKLKRL